MTWPVVVPPDEESTPEYLAFLVSRFAAGQEDAFTEFYARTSTRIYQVILQVVRSTAHAAEVTQEVYVEIWHQAARYSLAKGTVIGWVTTIARRRAIDRVRSVQTAQARDERYALESASQDLDVAWNGVAARYDLDRVRLGLASLTHTQREALLMVYFGGYTQTQLADQLELPLGTVKSRVRDALIALRAVLARSTD